MCRRNTLTRLLQRHTNVKFMPVVMINKTMKKIFWIAVAIDSILATLVFLSILGEGFSNSAPKVGSMLLMFSLFPIALGVAVFLFKLSNHVVAHRVALLIVLAPIPGLVGYGFYQDYFSTKNAPASKDLSTSTAEDAGKPLVGNNLASESVQQPVASAPGLK